MLIQIANILTQAECAALCDALSEDAYWRNGKSTAAGAAKRAKENLQADPGAAPVRGALAKVRAALLANEVFNAAAQPAEFARILISRYLPGMTYGDHVDAAYIDGVRADLSFTLSLSHPDEYDGGELLIESAGHTDSVKLPAGALLLYPSNTVHRVEAVTKGERIAAVGWIRSRVRSAEARAVIYDLETAVADAPEDALRLRLNNIRNNLLRIFGE